ncbi:hypothetical protein E2C01_040006 [Portunus trituberculatus]|uniref:Secreted protein n=1 Tax=Portunus trituberculatus TaxID=210409 RepID=A0A5B7FFA3_PORTR|nr:hypothetical protein [Portunus trituberculatus]
MRRATLHLLLLIAISTSRSGGIKLFARKRANSKGILRHPPLSQEQPPGHAAGQTLAVPRLVLSLDWRRI